MQKYDFLVVGGGIFGISSAIELARRNYKVGLINPDTLPHHLAASTDVSKAVRMEYGSDIEYFKMAEICIRKWREWNDILEEKIFHEVGFLMLCKKKIESDKNSYERHSLNYLIANGYNPERLNSAALKNRFPAVNTEIYTDACYNPVGGYVKSGKAIEALAQYARKLGVDIHEGQTAQQLLHENGKLIAVKTQENATFHCGHAIIAAGPYTPYLLPELKPFMKATGHPVFWLKPKDPLLYATPKLTVFMADISNTGWYGFPFLPEHGIVKVARHASGLIMDPNKDDRYVSKDEIRQMRTFIATTFPSLLNAPLVYTRRCLYADTLDGHFWIDQHPEIKGLTVSTGGSGHGMKMGPIIGEMTADVAEGKVHQFSKRYRWRHLNPNTLQSEEARNIDRAKI